jgi:hypothetical protein
VLIDKFKLNLRDFEKEKDTYLLNDAKELTKKIESLSRLVPVFDQVAFATPLSEWDTPEWLNERRFIGTTLPEDGKYFWFHIKGDSMSRDSRSSIENGDYVLGRELYKEHWKDKLQLHRVNIWIIIHKERGPMCKEIIHHNVNYGVITCNSWNTDIEPIDKQFDLLLDDVIKLYYFKELKREKL